MSDNKKNRILSFSKILSRKKGKDKTSESKANNNFSQNHTPKHTPRPEHRPNNIHGNGIIKNTRIQENDKNKFEFNSSHDEKESGIILKEYLEILFHYKWLVLIVFITTLLATIALSFLKEPVYKARTKIFVQEDVMEFQVINNKPYFKQAYDLNTWVQIMGSTEITKRAAEKLSNKISASAIAGMIEYSITPGEEHIITVTATSKDPELAADAANSIYYALSQYDKEQRLKGYTYSTEYLDQLLSEKRKEQEELTNSIDDFLQEESIDIHTVNVENNVERVNELQIQISNCKVDLAAISASVTKINYDLNREDKSIVNQTTYSEPYKIQLMNLEAEKAKGLTKYTEQHPKIKALDANIENIKKLMKDGNEKIQLRNVTDNPIRRRLINDFLSKETEKVALEQKIAALKKLLSEIEISPNAKKILEEKFNKKKDLITQIGNLQDQYDNAKLNTNISSSRLSQLQEAEIPNRPVSDNLNRDILIGIILGLGLGIGLAFLLNSFNVTIRSVAEYEGKYTIPIIGAVPKTEINMTDLVTSFGSNKEAKEDETQTESNDILDENVKKGEKKVETIPNSVDDLLKVESIFEPIIINFKYLLLSKDQKVFAIQSSLSGEGKTFISCFLANNLAKENLDVLLVDADFYKRTLTKKLGFKNKSGLSEVLSEQVELKDAIVHNKDSKFLFLPTGQKPPNVLEMYRASNFQYILEELKEMYDIVIIDTPAFLQVPSIAYFLSEVDGTIIPVRVNSTTYSSLNRTISKSETYNVNILGVIMNSTQFIDNKYYEYYYDYDSEDEDLDKRGKKGKKDRRKDVSEVQKPEQNIFQRISASFKNFLFFEEEE